MRLKIDSTMALNDGNKMPVLGLGTWKAKGKDVENAVLDALKAGYRLIDTAYMYGNEKEIGAAVKKSGVGRKEIFITTKIWEIQHANPEAAIEGALKALGVDYIDLYLIHWPEEERLQTWKMFEKFKKQGLCKSIGVSNFTISHLKELMKSMTVPAVNQVEFNPFLYQKELLDFCTSKNIVLEAYSPLSHGKSLKDSNLAAIAKKYKKSPAQIMLRWALQHGTVPIPKSVHKERIEENVNVFDFVISDADMKLLNALNRNFRTCWDPTNVP
ncbi:MAG TPA: aldo/keto reductase [archaeon]|nr:aldo/keto reductase [archaeon]